jgi:hypothetical protein
MARGDGVGKAPSYLGEFFRHPYNRMALLGAACAAIFASIPYGWTGLALVGVVAAGLEACAALLVPSLPSFKGWVDRQRHCAARARRRSQWLAELQGLGDSNALASYEQMCARVDALYRTVDDAGTSLTRQDVEKLEDLTVDYLGLSVVVLSLRQRKDRASEDSVAKRIASIQSQLLANGLPEEERRQLRSALAEYLEVVARSRRLASRRHALEAMLLAMPDKMEEVYQLVMTSPYSTETGGKLEESLSRLRIAEEVAAEFDTAQELGLAIPVAAAPIAAPRAARPVARSVKA